MSRGAHRLGLKTWRMCGKKRRYPDEFAAQKVAAHAMKLRPGARLRVYDCRECGGWHLTHKP